MCWECQVKNVIGILFVQRKFADHVSAIAVFGTSLHHMPLDSESEDALAKLGNRIQDEVGMLQDESGVLAELRLGLGGGKVVESGADEAGAVFARGGLCCLQFVAQRQQLLHLRHNPPLFGEWWERNRTLHNSILMAVAIHFRAAP